MVATHRNQELRMSFLDKIDAVLFAFGGLAAVWLGYLLVQEGARPGWELLLLVAFWVLLTYLLLPRLHRILTRIYVPGYFIGRARTSDGLLGDPVNLALLGHEAQVHEAMTRAHWSRADDISAASALGMIRSTLTRRSYPEAPVSPLLLFDRQQDFAYQQEVDSNPAKRHHVRFWRCAGGVDAARRVTGGLARGRHLRPQRRSVAVHPADHAQDRGEHRHRAGLHHRYGHPRTPEVEVEVIRDFSTGYHSRNGGGDLIQTDGDLPILDVRAIPAPALPTAEGTDSRAKRPMQIIFGSVVSFLRGGLWLFGAIIVFVRPPGFSTELRLDGVAPDAVYIVAGVLLLLAAGWDLIMGVANFLGRNWARLLLMLTSVVAVLGAFISNADRSEVITIGTLPTVAISILVLLALSSHPARDYSSRRRHQPKRLAGRPRNELPV